MLTRTLPAANILKNNAFAKDQSSPQVSYAQIVGPATPHNGVNILAGLSHMSVRVAPLQIGRPAH